MRVPFRQALALVARPAGITLLGVLAGAACADMPARNPPPRGSLGEELYGVVCDRVGGQTLHEDLTGASFHAICHKVDGAFASRVDQPQLPAMVDGQPDVNGKPVPLSVQQAQRAYGVARLERLAVDRDRLVAALDAAFPDIQVPIKDTGNASAAQSCSPASGGGMGSLHTELANLLARFTALYQDGTLPRSTEGLGAIVTSFNKSTGAATGAQASWARLNARAGYRPSSLALGTLRPVLAYPKLRDLTNDVVRVISPDSNPYAPKPPLDAQGNRMPVPGAEYAQMQALSGALAFELASEVDDPVPSPLVLPISHDAMVGGRTVLGRPRSTLEALTSIFFAQDATFASGMPAGAYVVLRDPRGFAALTSTGTVPAPFVDEGDGLPAIDAITGQFKTSTGAAAPSPFFALGATDIPTRDASQRALWSAGGGLVYDYIDTSQSFEGRMLAHLRGVTSGKSLVDSNAADAHETLMNLLAGAYALLGPRNTAATKTYGTRTYKYDGFSPAPSPLGNLLYALTQLLADPTSDATLAFTSALMKSNPNDVARVVGDTLWAKDQSNADTTAKIPAKSTFWDEMIDVLAAIAHDTSTSTDPQGRRLLEDILTAFAQPASVGLSKAVATQAANVDVITYDRNALNGPAVNTTKPGSPASTPVDRTKPDSGSNRSQLQRFAQLVHDTNGVTLCNKEGAIVHGAGIPVPGLPSANVCAPVDPSHSPGHLCCNMQTPCLTPDTACTCDPDARPFKECEVFKIENLAGFYLDSIAGKASLYFRSKLLRDGAGGNPPDGGLPDGAFGGGPGGAGAGGVALNEQSSGIGLHLGPDAGPDDTYNTPDAGPAAPGFWDPLTDTNANDCAYAYLQNNTCPWAWNPYASPPTLLRPKPGWLNRLAGFDIVNDGTMPATLPATNNYLTNHFITDLQGNHIGTTVCPERLIPDPCATNPNCFNRPLDNDVAFDGMVHGLRNCQDGQWLYQRDGDSFFLTEEAGFLDALTPLATAFANHGREDLFVQVMETLHKHWQRAAGAAAPMTGAAECTLTPSTTCTKDGADTYEPLLAKIFSSDLFTALNKITGIAGGMTVQTCSAVNAATHACTTPGSIDGIGLLASAARAFVDPAVATSYGLTDSTGKKTSQRNDGATNPQVTPIYLLLEALNAIDAALSQSATATPPDPDPTRLQEWRQARSQLVEELFGVKNENAPTTTSSFADPALPKITPVLLDTLRAQLLARCGSDVTTGKCAWARGNVRTPVMLPPTSSSAPAVPLWNEAMTTMSGPIFAAVVDLLEALRRDPGARAAQEDLLAYLADPAAVDAVGKTEALAELLSSSHDLLQVVDDAQNQLIPLYNVLATAFAPGVGQSPSPIDATTALLTRLAGRAVDSAGHEVCANEVDPNDVVSTAMAHLATPMPLPGCTPSAQNPCLGESPLEVIVDTIADVNRAGDSGSALLLRPADYGNISNELVEFMLDPQRGLEQFYEIVRQGTRN